MFNEFANEHFKNGLTDTYSYVHVFGKISEPNHCYICSILVSKLNGGKTEYRRGNCRVMMTAVMTIKTCETCIC